MEANVTFFKYEAAGNDFVVVDNRESILPQEAPTLYSSICDRRLGIGADGLILIQKAENLVFEMKYYNADGALGSMCGNGARASLHFAQQLGLVKTHGSFMAYDGMHQGRLSPDVSVSMLRHGKTTRYDDKNYFIDTGSPHHIVFVKGGLQALDVIEAGRLIRYSDLYKPKGANINFVEIMEQGKHPLLALRTYERGVEDETLSCGTGVTAAALVYAEAFLKKSNFDIEVQCLGGKLHVQQADGQLYLSGPVRQVFTGEITIEIPDVQNEVEVLHLKSTTA